MSQNLFTRSWAGQHPFLQPQATPDTPATASRPCLSLPTLKKQVGPTGLLQPGPLLHTACFGAIRSHPFTSDPVWGHGQAQEEHERWSEECGSVLGPQTFLVVSPGAQGDGAPQPALVMLCTAATLQPPVVTPGEDATLFKVEAAGDGGALVDRDMAGIRRVFQLLMENIMEELEVLADEEQQQGSSQDLEEKMLGLEYLLERRNHQRLAEPTRPGHEEESPVNAGNHASQKRRLVNINIPLPDESRKVVCICDNRFHFSLRLFRHSTGTSYCSACT